MGERGQGRIKIEPGPWSLAVAAQLSKRIDSLPPSRKAFMREAGFSTRLYQLLNGKRAWYLEDVDKVCTALGLDVMAVLDSLEIKAPHPALASVTRFPASDPAPILAAVADDQDEEIGSDPDTGYDHA